MKDFFVKTLKRAYTMEPLRWFLVRAGPAPDNFALGALLSHLMPDHAIGLQKIIE